MSNWLLLQQDWNPQLLRELKGRLRWRSAIAVTVGSLMAQWWAWSVFQHKLRLASTAQLTRHTDRTLKLTQQLLWFDFFHALTWIALLFLLILGCYFLVKDLAREERQGTLTFLRLSPQPAASILLGKVLGVPILLYLAIALVLPLHVCSAIQAGLSWFTLFSVYLLSAVACSCMYSFSVLHGLTWGAKAQPWYLMPPAVVLFLFLLMFWQLWRWRHHVLMESLSVLNESTQMVIFGLLIFLLTGLCNATICLWRMSIHRFHHPPTQR